MLKDYDSNLYVGVADGSLCSVNVSIGLTLREGGGGDLVGLRGPAIASD